MTEYTVKRRYTDFLWLREKLEAAFPAHLLPVRLSSDIAIIFLL